GTRGPAAGGPGAGGGGGHAGSPSGQRHRAQYTARAGDTYSHFGQARSGPAGPGVPGSAAFGLRVVVVEPSRAEESIRGFRSGLTRTTPPAGSPTMSTSRPSRVSISAWPSSAASATALPHSAPARSRSSAR